MWERYPCQSHSYGEYQQVKLVGADNPYQVR